MASVAALPSLYSSSSSSITRSNPTLEISNPSSSSSSPFSFLCVRRTNNVCFAANRCHSLTAKKKNFHGIITRLNAVEEEIQALIQENEETPVVSAEQPVSVPVSPSDVLTMFFEAEGTMSDSDIPKVMNALEKIEGVSDLQVRIVETIATVQLKKQTTVQATGVASNLVEVIQGSGFKLQSLNLSFEDEEDIVLSPILV